MILDKDTAKATAKFLLQTKAVKLSPEKPFTWASGWKSPIYCDNRTTLSYPKVRTYLAESMCALILKKHGKPDVIAGVATGAIAMGMLVAQKLGIPFVYVRPEPKKHGRQNQIEGRLPKKSNVLVVEDLISTGKSSLNAVIALENAAVEVLGMAAIFTYGFEVAAENFRRSKTDLFTLSDYDHLIEQAVIEKYVSEDHMEKTDGMAKKPQPLDPVKRNTNLT